MYTNRYRKHLNHETIQGQNETFEGTCLRSKLHPASTPLQTSQRLNMLFPNIQKRPAILAALEFDIEFGVAEGIDVSDAG